MASTSYVKRPGDTITVPFDMRAFVTAVGLQGVLPAAVVFEVRSQVGITVTSAMSTIGLVVLTVSGGTVGRVYEIGVAASAPSGDSSVDMATVRVRDPSLFTLLPTGTAPGAGAATTTWDAGATWDAAALWS